MPALALLVIKQPKNRSFKRPPRLKLLTQIRDQILIKSFDQNIRSEL